MADAAYYYATAPSDGGNVNMVSNQMMTDGGNAPEIMEQFFQLPFPIILAFSVVYVLTASFLGIFVASRFGSDEAWKVVTGPSSNKRRRRNRRRRR